MANQDGEAPGPSLASVLQSPAPALPSGRCKLPLLLTARPGNVGVQIDSHRAMNLFSRPRCGHFTAQFHGLVFEDGSLENYSRVVERTAHRARLLEDKLIKLREREQVLLADEVKRKQRRVQREAARQRRLWQQQQAAKRHEQRLREAAAAVAVQRVARGSLARRVAQAIRRARVADRAACRLQHALKAYVHRQQAERERERRDREEEARRESEMHSAASVLQRQARKRLQAIHAQAELDVLEEEEEEEEDAACARTDVAKDERVAAEALKRGISLDLLFSDDEGEESGNLDGPTPSETASVVRTFTEVKLGDVSTPKMQPRPPAPVPTAAKIRPRRPMSIKRVGGGFRATPLPPSVVDPTATAASGTAPRLGRRLRVGRPKQQATATLTGTGVSPAFLRRDWHSPTLPKRALSPTLTAGGSTPVMLASTAKKSNSPRRASPVRQALTGSSTSTSRSAQSPPRAPSPRAVVSPYAVPQTL